MSLVQITLHNLRVEKLPRGVAPVFEFELDDHQEAIGVYQHWTVDKEHRETVDHYARVWVASRL